MSAPLQSFAVTVIFAPFTHVCWSVAHTRPVMEPVCVVQLPVSGTRTPGFVGEFGAGCATGQSVASVSQVSVTSTSLWPQLQEADRSTATARTSRRAGRIEAVA